MKISIITPICNDVSDIESCLNSVLEQTYHDVELLIIDYGCTEENKHKLRRVLQNGNHRIIYGKHKCSEAINEGIREAKGDVICFLSPNDQLYNKGILQKIANTFVQTNANIVYGKGELKRGAGILKEIRRFGSRPHQQKQLAFGKIPLHTSIYIKKDLLLDLGFAKEDYKVSSEYELYLRLFMQQNVQTQFIDELVLKLNLHAQAEEVPSKPQALDKAKRSYRSLPIKQVALS